MTVQDWVDAQARLVERFGILKLAAVLGGSLGGMQALDWALRYPERLSHCIAIATAPNLSAQNIAFNEVARRAIVTDPDFHGGHFYEHGVVPKRGLRVARMIGHITYLSATTSWPRSSAASSRAVAFWATPRRRSSSRSRATCAIKGDKFSDYFDANTYLLITRALDYFDPASRARRRPDACLRHSARQVPHRQLHDRLALFTGALARDRQGAARQPAGRESYAEIDAPHGHDAFLLDDPRYHGVLRAYFERIAAGLVRPAGLQLKGVAV